MLVRHRRGRRRCRHDPLPGLLLRDHLRRGRGMQARPVVRARVQGGERLRRGRVHAQVPDRGRGADDRLRVRKFVGAGWNVASDEVF